MTGYQVFMNCPDQIETFKRANSGMNFDEIRIIMGKAWLALDTEQKSVWEAQATA